MRKVAIKTQGNLPQRQHDTDAGADLVSPQSFTLNRGETITVDLELRTAIPEGLAGLIVPRSGLGSQGLVLANTIGVIDAGYRGGWKAKLLNIGSDPITVSEGQRILQVLVVPVLHAQFVESEDLPGTVRGDGGFGSTGTQEAPNPATRTETTVTDFRQERQSHEDDDFILAADRYFAAHPELKPWENAEPGDVWALTVAGQDQLYRCGQNGLYGLADGQPLRALTGMFVTGGRRVWPEPEVDDE